LTHYPPFTGGHCAVGAKRGFQEPLELGIGHAVVLNRELFFCIACVLDVVGRIGENQVRRIADHQPCNVGLVCRVTDEQLVTSKNPQIPEQRNRRFRKLRDRIFVGHPLRGVLRREQPRQFLVIESDEADVEVFLLEGGQFCG